MAAGLDIRRPRLAAFADAFEEAVQGQVGDAPVDRDLDLDGESAASDWTLEATEALRRLAPFGPGNPEPVFLLRAVRPGGRPRLLGETEGHLAFTLPRTAPSGGTAAAGIRVIAFRRPDLFDLVASGAPVDLAVTPTVNEWRGTRTPELHLVAARPSDSEARLHQL
jgi:single-stranded-DNA-specific exonuclease